MPASNPSFRACKIALFAFERGVIDTQTEIFMVLEYAAGGELFDLNARRERVSELHNILLC